MNFWGGGHNSETHLLPNEIGVIIWNNKEIRIGNKPVYYKRYFESGIIFIKDLLFKLNTEESFNCIKRKVGKTNLLMWAGLRHSIPINLKLHVDTPQKSLAPTPILKMKNDTFIVSEKKSRDYYKVLISNKAQFPNAINNLVNEFHLSAEQLKKVFILPHSVGLFTAKNRRKRAELVFTVMGDTVYIYKFDHMLSRSTKTISSESKPEEL